MRRTDQYVAYELLKFLISKLAILFNYLLNVCVLQQVTGITEYGQCVHRQVSVIAAKALPALRLINGDDLGAKSVIEKNQRHADFNF